MAAPSAFHNERQGDCSICCTGNIKLVNLSKRCVHPASCCTPCALQSISTAIQSKGTSIFECPAPTCKVLFDPSEYYHLLGKQQIDLVDSLLLNKMLEKDEEFRWCKSSKGCGAGQLVTNHAELRG